MKFIAALILVLLVFTSGIKSQILEVKEGRNAIVKTEPTGDAQQFPDRLPEGTRVRQVGKADRYYEILLLDGRRGWSYTGNFIEVQDTTGIPPDDGGVSAQTLLARSDVLKIIVVDVEVGDATIIICPVDDGVRDVLLIDTGENDGDRIRKILTDNGVVITGKPISRMYITHYDFDHYGDAPGLVPLSNRIYDHGFVNVKNSTPMNNYLDAINSPATDHRDMSLTYSETFSGGVEVECVSVNQATDYDPAIEPSTDGDNDNSIALIISYSGFDYFTGGDLTKKSEKSLAKGIRNCDAYHVNHHGSRTTSSDSAFVANLDPEVSIFSNGTSHGHPNTEVIERLKDLGSMHVQTNYNPDSRAYQENEKYIADDTYYEDREPEDLEGALGTITIVVDPASEKYYVIMAGLPLSEGTFNIEKIQN